MNVLLVDDEFLVLKGMEAMLLSQKEVPLKVFTACDAFEGLEKLPQARPDVVIADVNMPEMDGLEMMEEARRRGYQGAFLIVSGYERVDYLKRAIQQQAADYLLKPVDKAHLLRKLSEIALERERRYGTLLFKLKMCMLENRHRSDLSILPEEVRALLPFRRLRLCAAGEKEERLQDVQRALESCFDAVLRFSQDNLTFFLLNADRSFTDGEAQEILRLCAGGEDILWGASSEQDAEEFAASICGDGVTAIYGEAVRDWVCRALGDAAPQEDAFHPFETVLGATRSEEALEAYADALLRECGSPEAAHRRAFVEIACYTMTIFGFRYTADQLRGNFRAQAQYIVDGQSFTAVLRNILFHFSCYEPDTPKRERYSEKIYQALLYIQSNHNRDLSLDETAGAVGLQPSYLSAMFKKETGTTFLQYLHEERMKHACRLLSENPGLSIEQVARQAGYNTATYFHKVFRSQFGMSPNQWRTGGAPQDPSPREDALPPRDKEG